MFVSRTLLPNSAGLASNTPSASTPTDGKKSSTSSALPISSVMSAFTTGGARNRAANANANSATKGSADSNSAPVEDANDVERLDRLTSKPLPSLPTTSTLSSTPTLATISFTSQSTKMLKSPKLPKQLLQSIANSDYETYKTLCDPKMTCFEPETIGNLVEGLDFHKFYFDSVLSNKASKPTINCTMLTPVVHPLGDESACIAYILLRQFIDRNGQPQSLRTEETRIWHKKDSRWQCIHFHRSTMPAAAKSSYSTN